MYTHCSIKVTGNISYNITLIIISLKSVSLSQLYFLLESHLFLSGRIKHLETENT